MNTFGKTSVRRGIRWRRATNRRLIDADVGVRRGHALTGPTRRDRGDESICLLPQGAAIAPRAPRRGVAIGSMVALMAGAVVVGGPSVASAAAYDTETDPNSMAAVASIAGAETWWNSGYTGAGVDVALIDTGVSPVAGLDDAGKVIYGPDLSFESQSPDHADLDTNGHGTFMAGLIAGHDTALTAPYAAAPASAYRGIAPDARLLSLKVASADGGTDVTQVIAAINWIVQHRNDNGLNVRVINLSYGTNSTQPAGIDPLSYAAEQAWKAGIVVVVAAGNTGYQRGNNAPGLADPAYNPYVIAVGGYDTNGTRRWNDDVVGPYSASSAGCGSKCKNPDFVAVGSHLQGLRVPGSFVDLNHPEGVVSERYFRGSGSSQAAAITSGSIALILQKYPNLTPDQVKRFITSNGQKVPGFDSQAQGAGEINLALLATKTPAGYVQKFTNSTGTGTIELARGSDHVTADGVVLTGEVDIFGQPINTTNLAGAEAARTTWVDGSWNGSQWTGSSWTGARWSSTVWTGARWSGATWSNAQWSGARWSGARWSGDCWSGSSWSGSRWSGNSWAAESWS